MKKLMFEKVLAQPAFTCSNSIMKALEKCMKPVQS